MSDPIIKRYVFGEEGQYFYEFTLQIFVFPGGEQRIVTVMMTSTNLRNKSTTQIDPYIPGLIQFLANICFEYDANYDAYHNFLVPYSYEDSANIADKVNEAVQLLRLPV